jgi:hypothetical protein
MAAYKPGSKITGFYAARDRSSGEYLSAVGWDDGYDDPWHVRDARWTKDLCMLSRSHRQALRILADLEPYHRRELDRRMSKLAQAQDLAMANGNQPSFSYHVDDLKRKIDAIHADMGRDIELLRVTVETRVTVDRA